MTGNYSNYTRVIRPLLWIALAAVHAPALTASWSMCLREGLDAARLSGCVGLTAAMVFFGLKLWNVAFLRFDTSARSLVLVAVAVALLHGNAIQRRLDCAVLPKDTPIAASTLLCLGLRRVQRAIDLAISRRAAKLARRILALSPGQFTRLCPCVPCRGIPAARPGTPRAPPA